MWAKSENRKVTALLRVDPSTVWPPIEAARYRKAPDDVAIGWDDDGIAFTPPAALQLTSDDFHVALYNELDRLAQLDKWDNRVTLMQRAAYPGLWHDLAQSFCMHVDACEAFSLDLLKRVGNGEAEPPASVEAYIAMLPTWEKPA